MEQERGKTKFCSFYLFAKMVMVQEYEHEKICEVYREH